MLATYEEDNTDFDGKVLDKYGHLTPDELYSEATKEKQDISRQLCRVAQLQMSALRSLDLNEKNPSEYLEWLQVYSLNLGTHDAT